MIVVDAVAAVGDVARAGQAAADGDIVATLTMEQSVPVLVMKAPPALLVSACSACSEKLLVHRDCLEADWPQRLVNRVRRQWTSAHVG